MNSGRVRWAATIGVLLVATLAGPAKSASAQQALPSGTITVPVGAVSDTDVFPKAASTAGMLFTPSSAVGTSWLVDYATGSAAPQPHRLPGGSCQPGDVLSERLPTTDAVWWLDVISGVSGVAPRTGTRRYVAPAATGWLEQDQTDGALYLATPSGAATVLGTLGGTVTWSSYRCDKNGFAVEVRTADEARVVVVEFASGVVSTVASRANSLTASGSYTPLAVSGDEVVYRMSGWNIAPQVLRHQVGRAPISLGEFAVPLSMAMLPSATAYVLPDPDGAGQCSLIWQPLSGSSSTQRIRCARQNALSPESGPGVVLVSVAGAGLRLGQVGTTDAGLYAVSPAGRTRLWAPPSVPAPATVSLSAGRVTWTTLNSTRAGVWTRPLSGSPLVLGAEAALSTTGALYDTSGRRSVWYARGQRQIGVFDGEHVEDYWVSGRPIMTGHRVLARDMIDLVLGKGAGGVDPDAEAYAMWGNLYYEMLPQRIVARPLTMNQTQFEVTTSQLGLAENAQFVSVAAHANTLAWGWVQPGVSSQSPPSTGIGWLDLATGQMRGPAPGVPTLNAVRHVWGNYVVATRGDALTGVLVIVLDVRDGHEVFRLDPSLGPDGVLGVTALGAQGLAWTAWSGEVKVTPLPDQHLAPRHEGNPFASPQFVLGTGSGMWVGEWVFTEALTTCAVDVKNAAGAIVKTLTCDPTYAAEGEAVVRWSGYDSAGALVAPGNYQWVLRAADVDGPVVDVDGVSTAINGSLQVSSGAAYVPLVPARVLDTRPSGATIDGKFAGGGPVGAGGSVKVVVLGRAGVPVSGVDAVTVNVTGVAPTAATFLTAYPNGQSPPNASTLNLLPGQVYANASVVKVGADGGIRVANAAGRTDVLVDVTGYYPIGGSFVPLTPARLTDTRLAGSTVDGQEAGGGAIPPGAWRDISAAGRAGVPTSGVSAVVVNITGVAPTAFTYLTAYPSGTTRPMASTQNLAPGTVVPNLAVVKLGTNGKIRVANAAGRTDVVVDVVGYVPSGTAYVPITPTRVLDTRTTGSPIVAGQAARTVAIAGVVGSRVPAGATGVVVNVTAVAPTAYTFLAVYPAKTLRPQVSTLNLPAGEVRANAALVKLSDNGRLALFNAEGSSHVVLDVVGYFSQSS